MLDEMKLFEQVNKMIDTKNGILDEIFLPFPTKRSEYESLQNDTNTKTKITIFVRTKFSEGGSSGKPSKHDCTVKVKYGQTSDSNVDVRVPVYAYDDVPSYDRGDVDASIKKLTNTCGKSISRVVMSFIYDNQMWLRALWHSQSEAYGTGKLIIDYLRNKIRDTDYVNTGISRKSEDALESDRKEVIEYVRANLGDGTDKLEFGSKQQISSKRKKKK